jgi:GNAT superfamily N-acetyltransferase
MHIRPATLDDAPSIARLHAESWQTAYRGMLSDAYLDGEALAERSALWHKLMHSPLPDQYVVVAELDEQIVGFACAFGKSDERWGTHLDNLHVAYQHKGRGIGTLLMAHVAAWADAAYPGQGLFLWVLEQNIPARRFYERLGAIDAGAGSWDPPGGGSVTVLRYAWPSVQPLLVPRSE